MTENNLSDLDKQMAPLGGSTTPLRWYLPDKPPFRLAGFAWYAQDRVYRRLPLAASRDIRDAVDQLANYTAGGQISFQSDSPLIAVKVALAGPACMNHMPATGQCGFDLYVGNPSAQRYHNTTKYDHTKTDYEALLFEHPDKVMRNVTLNFPLYQGVKGMAVGLAPDARIQPCLPWSTTGRIVVYGTSITQGGCASRPGMAYTNILSRALNVEFINLGFSGNGKGEPDVIKTFASIPDPVLFVLDYEANSAGTLLDTLPPAINIIRDSHPRIPILVVSRITYARDATHREALQTRDCSRDRQALLIANMRKRGDHRLYFLDGTTLLGQDYDECTVDGVHPNDLGFMRMARAMEPEIRKILANRI